MKFVFETIDQLAKQDEVSRVRMKFSILDVSNLKGLTKFNYLMKFGFFDNTINTQILDLSKTTEELKSDLRHGHSSDITKASKVLTVEFFDNKSINLEIFNQYVSLHQLASGKKTRPEITFQMMFNWIKEGEAFLVGAKKEEQFVGFSFFYLYKDNVYYGSSCNNPDLRELPISHFIQWQAINFMHQKGYRYYEIGWQHFYPSLSDFPSKKEIDISRFKRGFGGFTCLLMRGEKFYNNEYLIKCYQESLKKIIG